MFEAPNIPGGSRRADDDEILAMQALKEALRDPALIDGLEVYPHRDEPMAVIAQHTTGAARIKRMVGVGAVIAIGVVAVGLMGVAWLHLTTGQNPNTGPQPVWGPLVRIALLGLMWVTVLACLVGAFAGAATAADRRGPRFALPLHLLLLSGGWLVSEFVLIHSDPGFKPLALTAVALSALALVLNETWNKPAPALVAARRAAEPLPGRAMMALADVPQKEWGTPGQGGDAVDTFGEDNVRLGRIGEQAVAQMLAEIAASDPYVRVFHQIAFPGSARADIDHVIVRGNRSCIVDAKMWKRGHYAWDPTDDGYLLRDGHPFTGGRTHMPEAARAFAADIIDIGPYPACYVVLATQGQESTVDNSQAPLGVALAPISQAREWITEYLAINNPDDTEAARLDRYVLKFWHARRK